MSSEHCLKLETSKTIDIVLSFEVSQFVCFVYSVKESLFIEFV